MFNSITWAQYFSAIAFLLFCYYTVIGFRYYRWEILNLIGIKKVGVDSLNTSSLSDFKNLNVSENREEYLQKEDKEIDISPLVQSFTDEVHAYLQEAYHNKIHKNDLLNSLQIIALKYPVLKEADCRDELVHIVLNAADTKYPNLLQSNDVNLILN